MPFRSLLRIESPVLRVLLILVAALALLLVLLFVVVRSLGIYRTLEFVSERSDAMAGYIERGWVTAISGPLIDSALIPTQPIDHSQGEIAGEVTTTSVILQSRLTRGRGIARDTLDIPGAEGIARFELATSPSFADAFASGWLRAVPKNDFIVKTRVGSLRPGTRYYYRLVYGTDKANVQRGETRTFRTLAGRSVAERVRLAVVTGMQYVALVTESSRDRKLGFPALRHVIDQRPDIFVGTGDNVYYDIFPLAATTKAQLRAHWHRQFSKPLFIELFSKVATYWEKDDHDHRYNDSDTAGELLPSNELGIRTFLEQVPVVDPGELNPITYRSHRINQHLQIWLTEGRDYRTANEAPPGPSKTIWGNEQQAWLKTTLLQSDATFKLLISPTPMVGPDDQELPDVTGRKGEKTKRDNHVNPPGFRYEGEAFFAWLKDNGFLEKNFYIVCGDRHWQYHSIHPSGFEEFSTGAIVDANSRLGRAPGDPDSTDPDAKVRQPYTQDKPSAGFLMITLEPEGVGGRPSTQFSFYDDTGAQLYDHVKIAR
jgi:alkaline phosphatase/alkaline phosphatase D